MANPKTSILFLLDPNTDPSFTVGTVAFLTMQGFSVTAKRISSFGVTVQEFIGCDLVLLRTYTHTGAPAELKAQDPYGGVLPGVVFHGDTEMLELLNAIKKVEEKL